MILRGLPNVYATIYRWATAVLCGVVRRCSLAFLFSSENRISFSIHVDSPTAKNVPSYLLHEMSSFFVSVDIVS